VNDIQLQRNYYETNLQKPAMQPVVSAYVDFHLERVLSCSGLSPEKTLLEIGSGLGKFTRPLLERGFRPTCLDISPVMLERIRENTAPYEVRTILSDIAEAGVRTQERFEQAIGFFTLHHMSDLEHSFRGLKEVLVPGATAVFCEPRAYNPLFYLQIAATPGMSWRAEKGIVNMRRKYLEGAAARAGLTLVHHSTYGFFPPFVMNRQWGRKLNEAMEKAGWLFPLHAFQIAVLKNGTAEGTSGPQG